MIEQRQEWNNKVIYLISNEYGSVQLELYKDKQNFGGTCWLWDLFVVPEHRRQGHAKRLLKRAEEIAKNEGHKSVFLEWEAVNSEDWLLHYYLRQGYDEKQFSGNGDYYLLEKKL
ncbi:MAG: GNAT family N-acetyltransferase [Lachnospiraceae bacterium]|nr:GNAT family N-acetyltransferase [Lachnospiraceae bacterium]